MLGKWFWVIFVLLGLWQWIGSLAERATKKQQDQRVSNLAAQRRRQETAAHPTATAGTAQRSTGPLVADRAGELAARRKAQLDELRRRRGTATTQAPAPQPGPPPITTLLPSQARVPQPGPPPIATLLPTQAGVLQPGAAPIATLLPTQAGVLQPGPTTIPTLRPTRAPLAPVLRQPATRPQARRAPPQQQRPVQQEQRFGPPTDRSISSKPRTRKAAPEAVGVEGLRKLTLPGLGSVPMDRTLLRRMMLYREILEPPVALREVQTWER